MMYHVSQNILPSLRFSEKNFPNYWEFLNLIFHAYDVYMYATLQNFIQLSLTLTKLCRIMGDCLVNFYISLEF